VGHDVPLVELDPPKQARVAAMVDAGLVEETRRLVGRRLSRTAGRALGYEELLDHLAGGRTLDDAVAETARRTRRLARRQLRWFRRDPRVRWITPSGATGVVIEALTDSVQRPVNRSG
jgi:tRNA dimethylallyltransferase